MSLGTLSHRARTVALMVATTLVITATSVLLNPIAIVTLCQARRVYALCATWSARTILRSMNNSRSSGFWKKTIAGERNANR